MKTKIVFGLLVILFVAVGTMQVSADTAYSTLQVGSPDCTVVMPWPSSGGPANYQYPIIAWANGWDNGYDKYVTAGYMGGLSAWALDGPYIIIADNSRSPKKSDLLACLNWMVNQNTVNGSVFNGKLDTAKIGLAGHSQGAGIAILAGDGGSYGFNITGIVAMNPYAPNWNGADSQKGPALLFGGTDDTTCSVERYTRPAFDKIVAGSKGAVLAVLQGGTHSGEVWQTPDFGRYQTPSNLWWQKFLNDDPNAGRTLKSILDQAPWTTTYSFTDNFQLP